MSLGFSASDLLALPQFAWKVYKACRDSAADFTQLASEIQSMHTVLNELATQHRRRCLTDESISRLVTIQKGCQEILKSVEDQLLKYKNLGTGKKRLRDKLRWSLEGIGNLRLRLISHTNMLTLFIVTLERPERLISHADQNSPIQGGSSHGLAQYHQRARGLALPLRLLEDHHPKQAIFLGISQVCMRCRILNLECADELPCPDCIQCGNLHQLPCRRGCLSSLVKDLIPNFFWSSRRNTVRNPIVQQEVIEAIGTSSLIVHCGLIDLNLQLGTPYKKLNDTVSVVVLEAIHAFQTTFPDRYGFRVKLISKALRYEASDPDNAPVIAAAQKLLILSLVISHKLGIILPIGTSEEVRKYLFHEIGL